MSRMITSMTTQVSTVEPFILIITIPAYQYHKQDQEMRLLPPPCPPVLAGMLLLSNVALHVPAAVPSQLVHSLLAVGHGAAIHLVVRLLVNQRLI